MEILFLIILFILKCLKTFYEKAAALLGALELFLNIIVLKIRKKLDDRNQNALFDCGFVVISGCLVYQIGEK